MSLPSLLVFIEYSAALGCALGATALACKKRIGWILLSLGCCLYGIIFFVQHLYANTLLQVAFIILGILGIINTYKVNSKEEEFKAGKLTIAEATTTVAITAVLVVICYLGLSYSNDPYPWLDGILTALSLLAQYWMARKYAISWILWLITDACYAVWFIFYLNMRFTGGLYVYLSLLSVHGYLNWKKSTNKLTSSN